MNIKESRINNMKLSEVCFTDVISLKKDDIDGDVFGYTTSI